MPVRILAFLVAMVMPGTIYAVDLHPVALSDDNITRIGKLEYLSGWHIVFDHKDGGGISALELRGSTFTAITDRGKWTTGSIERKGDLLTNIRFDAFRPILDLGGKPLDGKKDEDSEGLSIFGNKTFVSFERNHRIWQYNNLLNKANPVSFTLPGFGALKGNNGIEAITHLADGRLVVMAEGGTKSGNAMWIVGAGQGSARKMRYKPESDFSPTALATLPDNKGVALLERAFDPLRGPRIRILWLSMDDLDNRKMPLRGRELAVLKRPLVADNFEGISANKGKDGGIILDIVSDDNFNPLQRSLWLRFRWSP